MGHSIYLADDEKSIRELLHSFLASDGYTVRSFESGDALLEAFRQEPAELVILDIMMPGTDGLTVCRELRSVSDIPIILLTAKDSELDYVMGISQGSDDYLTKPFRPTILLMKVRALLRRVEMDRGKTAAAVDELRYGDLRYSATENAVFCGSTIVALTQTELRLLSYMMKQPEKAGLEGFEKGQVTELGAVNVMTGIYTGRSPKDKFLVKDATSENTVWWTMPFVSTTQRC